MTASNNTSTTPEFITLDEAAAMTTGTRVVRRQNLLDS